MLSSSVGLIEETAERGTGMGIGGMTLEVIGRIIGVTVTVTVTAVIATATGSTTMTATAVATRVVMETRTTIVPILITTTWVVGSIPTAGGGVGVLWQIIQGMRSD